jgi:hypothetical protein
MKTSFHISGFWFHVEWNGNEGIDHRGNKWRMVDGQPQPAGQATEIAVIIAETSAQLIKALAA